VRRLNTFECLCLPGQQSVIFYFSPVSSKINYLTTIKKEERESTFLLKHA
jgi:hypothetical protein